MSATEPASAGISTTVDGGVATVVLDRPEALNALTSEMLTELAATLDRLTAEPTVEVIVLTGAGRAFCAGADMGEGSIAGATIGDDTDVTTLVGERHPHFVTGMRKPIVAAINGACAGIGLTQALMCDVRFAAAGAKFTTAFSRRGLIAEYGISWILPRIVGHAAALDLLLSGRTFLAEEAVELGLVTDVVAPDGLMARAVAYAEDLAAHCAPSSMAVIKRQMYDDALRELAPVSADAEKLMHESMGRPDFIEGITAFFEKRPPNFPPLSE